MAKYIEEKFMISFNKTEICIIARNTGKHLISISDGGSSASGLIKTSELIILSDELKAIAAKIDADSDFHNP
jgi:hypothetical protein